MNSLYYEEDLTLNRTIGNIRERGYRVRRTKGKLTNIDVNNIAINSNPIIF
jgi:hypothetical protein